MEGKLFSFRDGMPTGPDVDLLLKQWPEPKVGDRFAYQDVEVVLGIERTAARWKSITDAWRKRLLERGFVVQCETGNAFYVASSAQITARTYTTLSHIGKSAKKQRRFLSTVRPENETERHTVEHQARVMLHTEREAKRNRTNILPSTKPAERPKIAPKSI